MHVRGGNTKYKIKGIKKKLEILGQKLHPTYINTLQFLSHTHTHTQNMPCTRSAIKLLGKMTGAYSENHKHS